MPLWRSRQAGVRLALTDQLTRLAEAQALDGMIDGALLTIGDQWGWGAPMRCPKCGSENPAGIKFCGKCRTALTALPFPALNDSADGSAPTIPPPAVAPVLASPDQAAFAPGCCTETPAHL